MTNAENELLGNPTKEEQAKYDKLVADRDLVRDVFEQANATSEKLLEISGDIDQKYNLDDDTLTVIAKAHSAQVDIARKLSKAYQAKETLVADYRAQIEHTTVADILNLFNKDRN